MLIQSTYFRAKEMGIKITKLGIVPSNSDLKILLVYTVPALVLLFKTFEGRGIGAVLLGLGIVQALCLTENQNKRN